MGPPRSRLSRGELRPRRTLRVTRDDGGTLRVRHGATEIATIKDVLGGAVRIEADGRRWRLERGGGDNRSAA